MSAPELHRACGVEAYFPAPKAARRSDPPAGPGAERDVETAMENPGLTLLGTAAGLCTTLSFVPQVAKAWREGDTQAISLRMYWVSLTAFVLWMVHGLMVERLPIVGFTAFNVILGGLVLWLTLRGRRAGGARRPDSAGR